MLAKVAGSNQFKVGTGDKSWSELEYQPNVSGNNGLIYKDGELIVDFAQMPYDTFQNFLIYFRCLSALTDNLSIYVNADTGSDVLSEGRGTIENPFKTVQAAVNYVSGKFNLLDYFVTFYLHGTFTQAVNIFGFQALSGRFVFRSYNGEYSGKIHVSTTTNASVIPFSVCGGRVHVYDIEIKYTLTSIKSSANTYHHVVNASATCGINVVLLLITCHISLEIIGNFLSYTEARCIVSSSGALVYLACNYNNSAYDVLPGQNIQIVVTGPSSYSNGSVQYIRCERNGYLEIAGSYISQDQATIYCAGQDVYGVICMVGSVVYTNTGYNYKAIFKTLPGKTCTGNRYRASWGGVIYSDGSGANYFPGSIAGTTDTGKGSIYA